MKKIIRIFPRRTQATPEDDEVRIGFPDLFPPEADEYHVSASFIYDLALAEQIAEAWSRIGRTLLGGPAAGDPGGEFEPGKYLKRGYVITSRGCPNRCAYCYVPQREGRIREIEIKDGWRIQDNNLLACSRAHIEGVFSMLARQPHRARFQGGLEARLMRPWIAEALKAIKPLTIYLAYDKPSDREPLAEATRMLREAGFKRASHTISAYVLIGARGDTFEKAEERMRFVCSLGIMPFAMLFRDDAGRVNREWRKFQKRWCRPVIIGANMSSAP